MLTGCESIRPCRPTRQAGRRFLRYWRGQDEPQPALWWLRSNCCFYALWRYSFSRQSSCLHWFLLHVCPAGDWDQTITFVPSDVTVSKSKVHHLHCFLVHIHMGWWWLRSNCCFDLLYVGLHGAYMQWYVGVITVLFCKVKNLHLSFASC